MTGFHMFLGYIFNYPSISSLNVLILTIKKNGVLVRRNQFTTTDINYSRLVIPIVTTKACKVNFYWSDPNSSFKVYAPTITNFNNSVAAAYTYANGITSFPINLNVSGTWYVVVDHSIFFIQNVTARITT
jgi:hypothetical protein